MPGKTLLIRADASAEIGVGHVMRCAGLAQAWRNQGGSSVFVLATGPSDLEQRLCSEASEVVRICAEPGGGEDAAQTKELGQRYNAQWLLLDGFHFSTDYRACVRNGTHRLMLMDDLGDLPPCRCDLVVNSNPQASDAIYTRCEEQTRLLLGPRYALVRQEFLEFQGHLADVPEKARRVLITFGGADPHNVTLQVAQALNSLDDLQLDLTVVVGASNPHRASLRAAVDGSAHVARLLVDVRNMPELMSHADLAITAGGGTCDELAFMKVPMFLVIMAKNHERTVEAYGEAKAAYAAGWFDSLGRRDLAASLRRVVSDQELRNNLRDNASRMVDGLGAQRVVQAMLEIS